MSVAKKDRSTGKVLAYILFNCAYVVIYNTFNVKYTLYSYIKIIFSYIYLTAIVNFKKNLALIIYLENF